MSIEILLDVRETDSTIVPKSFYVLRLLYTCSGKAV